MTFPDDWGNTEVAQFANQIVDDPSSYIEDGKMSFGRAPFDDIDPISVDDAKMACELEITEITGVKAFPDIDFIKDIERKVRDDFPGVEIRVGGWMHGPTNSAPGGLVFFDQIILDCSTSPSDDDELYEWITDQLESSSDIAEPEHIQRAKNIVYVWWPR